MKRKNSDSRKIAIIGAGFGGLAAAFDLCKAGFQVVVYDRDDQPGGLAGGFKEDHWEWTVEKYYHHWFASDRHVLGLINELGWRDRVVFLRPYTVLFDKGKFYPFDSILTALLNPTLGWGINKIRFGLVGLYLRLTSNWSVLEKQTAEAWMTHWVGENVYNKMWEPLLRGKFGDQYMHDVNMAWFWARLHARTTRLGTFKGGFQAFADALQQKLVEMGVVFIFGTDVEKITKAANNRLEIYAGREKPQIYDACLVTSSPARMADMAVEMPVTYLEGLRSLKHMGAVVLVLSMDRQLSRQGYYWYNLPKSAGFPFLALVEHTNFVSPDHFGSDHIVYVGDYLEPGHGYFKLDAQQLLDKFLPGLKRINPDFQPDWIKKCWLFRTEYAQPVPLIFHSKNIPDIRTPVRRLYFASMSQVYPWDRGTNYAVEIGRRAAGMMLDDLKAASIINS